MGWRSTLDERNGSTKSPSTPNSFGDEIAILVNKDSK
jgi:hypothetical protein